MVEDRWYSVAIPILEFVHENGHTMGFVSVGAILSGDWDRTKRGHRRGRETLRRRVFDRPAAKDGYGW